MKKFTRFFSALIAFFAVGLVTVSLAAYSTDDDSDSGSSVTSQKVTNCSIEIKTVCICWHRPI